MIKTVALRSIGCRTNQQEMMDLSFHLMDQGFSVVDNLGEAEAVVVNTCAVTSATEAKTRRMLRHFTLESPRIAICVAGCLSQQKAHEMKLVSNVRWVVGNDRKKDIPEILKYEKEGIFCGSPAAPRTALHLLPAPPIRMNPYHRTRFPIKIQEGCDFRCAYCIVPFLRGASRSAPAAEIIAICKEAIDAGYKELVLTGTHIGQFGDEQENGLMELLYGIAAVSGDFRVRLSSLDPRDLSPALIDIIGTNPRFCRHLHLSLQSLSPRVLAAMNRSDANVHELVETLIRFRMRFPDAGIGGDFIVGFPGETEADFYETLGGIEKVGFSYGHVFRFSKRPMTAAATYPEQIDEQEKRRRSERLRAVLDRCRTVFVERLIGTRHRIIVEKKNPVVGRAANYLPVEIPEGDAPRNQWCTAMIKSVRQKDGCCIAELAH